MFHRLHMISSVPIRARSYLSSVISPDHLPVPSFPPREFFFFFLLWIAGHKMQIAPAMRVVDVQLRKSNQAPSVLQPLSSLNDCHQEPAVGNRARHIPSPFLATSGCRGCVEPNTAINQPNYDSWKIAQRTSFSWRYAVETVVESFLWKCTETNTWTLICLWLSAWVHIGKSPSPCSPFLCSFVIWSVTSVQVVIVLWGRASCILKSWLWVASNVWPFKGSRDKSKHKSKNGLSKTGSQAKKTLF